LEHDFIIALKLLGNLSFWCVRAYELLKESAFQLFWHDWSNDQIIFSFGWVEDFQTTNSDFFCYL